MATEFEIDYNQFIFDHSDILYPEKVLDYFNEHRSEMTEEQRQLFIFRLYRCNLRNPHPENNLPINEYSKWFMNTLKLLRLTSSKTTATRILKDNFPDAIKCLDLFKSDYDDKSRHEMNELCFKKAIQNYAVQLLEYKLREDSNKCIYDQKIKSFKQVEEMEEYKYLKDQELKDEIKKFYDEHYYL